MKTIVERLTSLSKFIVDDNTTIIMNEDNIELLNMVVYGLNKYSILVFENVIPPSDWVGNKYHYDDLGWKLNSNWVSPEQPIPVISLEEKKIILNEELAALRKEVAVLITECQLVNNPQPQLLIDLIDLARNTYLRVKNDIDVLNDGNYLKYHLQTEELNILLNGFKSFL